jgi:hypothetical protein
MVYLPISILVHINFSHNPTLDPYDEYSSILIGYLLDILNDCKHDLEFVQHCFKHHWQYMLEQECATQWH